MAITPKKKPNRIYMTDDNSGVIYSDKQGNVISKDEAMKNFRDSASAEKREKRKSSQYEKKNKHIVNFSKLKNIQIFKNQFVLLNL